MSALDRRESVLYPGECPGSMASLYCSTSRKGAMTAFQPDASHLTEVETAVFI